LRPIAFPARRNAVSPGWFIAVIGILAMGPIGSSRPQDPIADLIGTWVRDSATGPDDRAVPNGATVRFSRTRTGVSLVESASAGAKPQVVLDCPVGAADPPKPGPEGSRACVMSVSGSSISYAVYGTTRGKVAPDERGRITISADGRSLEDRFERYHPNGSVTHHRHIYHRSRP
jgi:hypothetical protein